MGMFTMASGFWGLFSGHHYGICTYLLLQVRSTPRCSLSLPPLLP